MPGILDRARGRLPAQYLADGGGILPRYQRTPTQHSTGYSYDTIKYQQHPWDVGQFVTQPLGILETNNTVPTQYTYQPPAVEDIVADTSTVDNGSSNLIPTPIVEDPVVDPNVISTVPDEDLTGLPGQDNQYINPDINYEDAYVADNNQIVGTLDPSEENLETASEWVDPSFYTDPENPIYSASDFELGSSTEGTDFVTDYSTDEDNETDIFVNDSGSTVDIGYGVGEVDPGLAEAAGYTPPGIEINEPVFEDDTSSDIPVIPPTHVELPTTEIPDNYIDPGLVAAAGIEPTVTESTTGGYDEVPVAAPTPEPIVVEATPDPEWKQAGYKSEYQYNNSAENAEWDESYSGAGYDSRVVYDKDGNYSLEYRYGDQVFDNSSDARYAKNLGEADPTERTFLGDSDGDGEYEYAYNGEVYNSSSEARKAENIAENNIADAAWETPYDGAIHKTKSGYDNEGNSVTYYERDGLVFESSFDAIVYGSTYKGGGAPIGYVDSAGNTQVGSAATTPSGESKYVDISTGSGSDSGPSAAAIAAASVSSDNTQVQHDYSGPSHGYDDGPSSYSPPSYTAPSYGGWNDSNAWFNGGGIIQRANQGGRQQSPYRGILMNKLNRRNR